MDILITVERILVDNRKFDNLGNGSQQIGHDISRIVNDRCQIVTALACKDTLQN